MVGAAGRAVPPMSIRVHPITLAALWLAACAGAKPPPDQRELKKRAVGTTFDEEAYDAAKAALVATLKDRGHPEAAVEGEVRVDPIAHTAAITLELQPGEEAAFGEVQVHGARKVPEKKIAS